MCIRSLPGLISVLLLITCSPIVLAKPQPAQATLPLDEVIRLYREGEEAKDKQESPPPIRASVDSIDLRGQVLDRSLEITARVAITVLEQDQWVSIPILRKDPDLNLAVVPKLSKITLTVIDDYLTVLTNQKGTFEFVLKLTKAASTDGALRVANIDVAPATAAVFRAVYDPSSFALKSPVAIAAADETIIFPNKNRFAIRWERLRTKKAATSKAQPAPTADPIITNAHVSIISTLEGQRIGRALYDFQIQGRHQLRCILQPGQTLERLFLNGTPQAFQIDNGEVVIEAQPARAGGDTGTVEVLYAETPAPYHLAGKLPFAVPTTSWPQHELLVTLHLPDVFDYSWVSGSLEPADTSSPAAYTHQVPTPGVKLAFHQYLVLDSAPRLTLDYTVNLDGQYFRP